MTAAATVAATAVAGMAVVLPWATAEVGSLQVHVAAAMLLEGVKGL